MTISEDRCTKTHDDIYSNYLKWCVDEGEVFHVEPCNHFTRWLCMQFAELHNRVAHLENAAKKDPQIDK